MESLFEKTFNHYNEVGSFIYDGFTLEEKREKIRPLGGLTDDIASWMQEIDCEPIDITPFIQFFEDINEDYDVDVEALLNEVNQKQSQNISVLYDELFNYLNDNKEIYNKSIILKHIKSMILDTTYTYVLKIGLTMYHGLDYIDEEINEAVKLFAMVGDVSFYCIPIILKWKDKNRVLEEIIKKSCGYAKSNATDAYEPQNKEERIWLLHNGTDWFRSYYASATSLTKKCQILDMIHDPELAQEDYDEIGRVVGSYFSEGPAVDLHTFNWKEVMLEYINLVKTRPTEGGLYGIYLILIYEDFGMDRMDKNLVQSVIGPAKKIWNDPKIRNYVREQVNNHTFIRIAELMHIAHVKKAYEAFCMDPIKNSEMIIYFENNKKYTNHVISKYMNLVDFSKINMLDEKYENETKFIYYMLSIIKEYNKKTESFVCEGYKSKHKKIHSEAELKIYYWGKKNMLKNDKLIKIYEELKAGSKADKLEFEYLCNENVEDKNVRISEMLKEKILEDAGKSDNNIC